MTFLKGRIRGAQKTQLGTATNVTKGHALNASDKQYQSPEAKEFTGNIIEVLQMTEGEEKVLFPYVRVRLKIGSRAVDWPYWLKITNSPDEIQTIHGGLKNISEEKPFVKIRFTSQSKRDGFVTLGTSSADIDDYGEGQIREYDGVLIA